MIIIIHIYPDNTNKSNNTSNNSTTNCNNDSKNRVIMLGLHRRGLQRALGLHGPPGPLPVV